MNLSIWSDVWNKIDSWAGQFRDFILAHSRNPFLWVGIILIGLLIFEYVYKSLHKD